MASKYQSSKVAFARRTGKEDDVVELLATGSGSSGSNGSTSSVGSGRGLRSLGQREPPKDLFQDV